MVSMLDGSAGRPNIMVFEDLDEMYLADSCEALVMASDRGEVGLSALARSHYPGARLPDGVVEGVLSIGSWNAASDQVWGLGWHRNEGIELTLVGSGMLEFAVDSERWQLEAAQLTVTRPWQLHRVGDPLVKASTLHWLIIDVGIRRPHQYWQWPSWVALAKADLARLSVLLQGNENPVLPTSQRLRDAFTKATSLAKAPGSTLDSELRLSISLVLLELLHTLEAENRDLDESLVAPRRGVRTFLADLPAMLHRPWTVPLMARACSMGTTQFTALCKDITNKTPVQHLNELRVRRARDLLAHTHDPINDIAVACGFDSAQYFATKFRAATGQSPSDFRRSHKGPSVGGDTISPV